MRYLVIRPRGHGKTEELLAWMRRNPKGRIVSVTHEEAMRLADANEDIDRDRFLWLEQVRRGSSYGLGREKQPLAIDNLDRALRYLLDAPVEIASVSDVDLE